MSDGSPVRVWDLPTRLFHWLLVVLLGFSWWSAETRHMDWHFRSGLAVLMLLALRLIWGFVGGSTARFSGFVRPPGAVLAYLRKDAPPHAAPGHNPLGGYSVMLILLLLSVQVVTGLFSVDIDGIDSGPLSFLVSFDQGRAASALHHLSFTLVQTVAGIHILAVLFYLAVRKRNLIVPMLTGSDRQLSASAGELVRASPLRFAAALAIACALAWLVSKGLFL